MEIKSKFGNIEIGSGFVKMLPEGFVVSDNRVASIYRHLIKGDNLIIEPGEKSKSFENYKLLLESITKDTKKIVALGGGVVGDLAGFAASTYKRGIGLVQVPTTLLAMVDSSIGGKNGINLGNKKNYVGTVYQPEKILIDISFLKSLPKEEIRNGVAEIIKYGYIFGNPKLERIGRGITAEDKDMEEIITQCCKNKLEVVEKDEKDRGIRHVLNFGHTIGHAIELLCNLSHGEAISIGMAKEAEIAEKLGICTLEKAEKLKKTIQTNGLLIKLPNGLDKNKVIDMIKHDKKGDFVFALNRENYNIRVEEKIVREVLGI